jgi:hypothetical protein
LLLRFEAHDLAYKTAGLGYGAFTLRTSHGVDVVHIVLILSVGVGRRSGLLAASAASGLAVWRSTVGELCLVDWTRKDVRGCNNSKADGETAAEERHGGPRTRVQMGDHCELTRVLVASMPQS